jgi:hypothetical protein
MGAPSTQPRFGPTGEISSDREPRGTNATGVPGNAALTATTSVVLLTLLAIEGFTVLRVRALFVPHVFLGMLLIPPILLKLSSVGYRFVRYYTRNPKYRAAGPPKMLPRVLGPFVVLTTMGLFASGIILLLVGPSGSEFWRRLHTVSFLAWFCVMSVHVLLHLRQAPTAVAADVRQAHRGRGPADKVGVITRQSLVLGSVLLGVILAVTTMPLNTMWLH